MHRPVGCFGPLLGGSWDKRHAMQVLCSACPIRLRSTSYVQRNHIFKIAILFVLSGCSCTALVVRSLYYM